MISWKKKWQPSLLAWKIPWTENTGRLQSMGSQSQTQLSDFTFTLWCPGLPDTSVGKEFTCNSGDPSLIPGLGRSIGEGIGHPLQHSWASLVAQLVKNPPAMQETWVRYLSWEDPLEKGKATHPSILAWRIPWTIQFTGLQRIGQDWVPFTFTFAMLTWVFYAGDSQSPMLGSSTCLQSGP